MAKIRRVTQTDVNAPDLTQRSQNINIPAGAFGQDVSRAVSNLGRSIEFSAEKLGDAHFRMQERQSISDASEAFKDVPIMASNLFEEMKRNPGNLLDFHKSYLAALDVEAEKISKGIENPRTRKRFQDKYLGTRTAMGKSAVTWAGNEFIIQGAGKNRAEINSIISAAALDISQIRNPILAGLKLDEYYDQIEDGNKTAEAAGFVRDAKIKSQADRESLDLTIAGSLIKDQPLQLKDMLDAGIFSELKDAEEDKIREQLASSLKRQKEQADFSVFAAELSKHTELSKLVGGGTAKDSDILNSALPDWAKDYWMDQYSGSEEAKIRKAVKAKEVLIERDRRLGLTKGRAAKKLKPNVTQKDIAKDNLNVEFLRIAEINKSGEVAGVESLNEALGFVRKVFEEHDKGFITDSERKNYIELLMPSLNDMIDSKYWEGKKPAFTIPGGIGSFLPGGAGAGLTKPIVFGGRPKNIYADKYSSALSKLELMSTRANTERGRVIVMSNIIKHIERAKKLEGKDLEKALNDISRNAVIDLMYELFPETEDIPYDDYPTSIGSRTPIELDTIEPADAETFNKQDRLDALIGGK